jgi:hypothetical protein
MNYGAIVAWEDDRSSVAYDIYAQRVDSGGNLLWQPDGVPICFDPWYLQENIVMCSDEVGGAIIVWLDYRNSFDPDIYAQRIDSNGNCLWQTNGIPVCIAADRQHGHRVISDGRNGAIIIWMDRRYYPEGEPLFAQRIDSSGVARWQTNGVPVCTTAAAFSGDIQAIADGAGGAYIVYQDHILPQYSADLYFQHIDSLGNHLLPWTGVCIVGEEHLQNSPKLSSSSDNTLIVCWTDERNVGVSMADIYAIRIDTLGNPLWDSTGVSVCTADSSQSGAFGNLIPDGFGGGIMHWWDYRNGSSDIYAQRIDMNGNQVWQQNGVPVIALPGVYHLIRSAISDDSSGAIYWWDDDRNGFTEAFFQRIGADGLPRWASNGVRACTVSTGERWGSAICSDGKGGAIAVWTDYRYGSYDTDIWGQRVSDGHEPGVEENIPVSVDIAFGLQVFPNPFTHVTDIGYQITDNSKNAILEIYDVTGCRMRCLNLESNTQNQKSSVVWDGKDNYGHRLPAGVYFVRLEIPNHAETKKVILLD